MGQHEFRRWFGLQQLWTRDADSGWRVESVLPSSWLAGLLVTVTHQPDIQREDRLSEIGADRTIFGFDVWRDWDWSEAAAEVQQETRQYVKAQRPNSKHFRTSAHFPIPVEFIIVEFLLVSIIVCSTNWLAHLMLHFTIIYPIFEQDPKMYELFLSCRCARNELLSSSSRNPGFHWRPAKYTQKAINVWPTCAIFSGLHLILVNKGESSCLNSAPSLSL